MSNQQPCLPRCLSCGGTQLTPLGRITAFNHLGNVEVPLREDKRTFWGGAMVELRLGARVCGDCGSVWPCLDQEGLATLRGRWSDLDWPTGR